MKFGPVPIDRLPGQDPAKVMLLAERWQRASHAHSLWAGPAKEAIDFLEGRQYTLAQLADLKRKRKPSAKFNIIAPIVRLVLGYQRNNRTDITFSAGDDNLANDDVAEALTKLEKATATNEQLEFIDGEVFLDGLAGGRGFYDTRLDWERNDLGEAKTVALDPFSCKIDPDCSTYDLNETASYVQVDRMVSIDEIEAGLGKNVAELVRPWTRGQTPLAPLTSVITADELSPIRYFGNREDAGDTTYWDTFYSLMGDFVDPWRKTVRLIETQHKVRARRNVMIDLETGDKKILPVAWGQMEIEKALLYAEMVDNPCVVEERLCELMHWTTTCADVILYDAPSFYDSYTMTGYFPYFRRGVTRGMVEDLVDPQKEKNRNRNNRTEVLSKSANGGWLIHESSMSPVHQANLKKFGSQPGVNLEWKGQPELKPTQIQPSTPPMGYERLEKGDDEDIRRISGVNESALGDTDISNQSGRAIEARQRQAVISVQLYMDNLRRSKHLKGQRDLYIFQNFYTEQRIYRVTGEDGKKAPVIINMMEQDPASGAKRIINDITLGKYSVVVDERPASATFEAGQFEEAMRMLEKLAPVLGNSIGMFADLIMGMSSLPRKQEWIDRLQMVLGIAPEGGAPPPQGALPPPAQQAALPPPAPAPGQPAPGHKVPHTSPMAPAA